MNKLLIMSEFKHILFSICCIPNTRHKPSKNNFTHAVLLIEDDKDSCMIDFNSSGVCINDFDYTQINDNWYYSEDMMMSGYVIEKGELKNNVKNVIKLAKQKWKNVHFRNRQPYNCIAFSTDVINNL